LRGIDLILRNNLLYYVSHINNAERLCIPYALIKEVFEIAHDRNFHARYYCTYERICSTMFI
jgi:hypothetical protein